MRFTFDADDAHFSCTMRCTRCKCTNRSGSRCRRRSCIGTGYCWVHLMAFRHLLIRTSEEPGAGRGVFVADTEQGPNAVIFRKGDIVIEYDGERIVGAVVDRRYGTWTAPYTVQNTGADDLYEDAACHRGVGAIVNQSKSRPNVEFVSMGSGRGMHVSLVALKRIKNHSELLVNYNGTYELNEPTRHSTR